MSLVLAEGVHVVGPGTLTVPRVNLSIGGKEQEEGKEKEKVVISGCLKVESTWRYFPRTGCMQTSVKFICLTDVTVKDTIGDEFHAGLHASGAGTKMILKNVKVENCQNNGVYVWRGATLDATGCHFHQNGGIGVHVFGSTTTARLTNCTSHDNKSDGVIAYDGSVVDLMGEGTSVHDNEGHGLSASDRGTINVYQPCVLNDMSHGNKLKNINMEDGGCVQQRGSK
jgi:hypothetical protein